MRASPENTFLNCLSLSFMLQFYIFFFLCDPYHHTGTITLMHFHSSAKKKEGIYMSEKIKQLTEIIRQSSHIVFFGGAGVSTASDIPDFRSSNGLFSQKLNRNLSPEQLVSHTFFVHYPEEFFSFYKKKSGLPRCQAKCMPHRPGQAGGNGKTGRSGNPK